MKIAVLLLPLLLVSSRVFAESAAEVEPLPDAEFMQQIENYPLTLSAEERQAVLQAIAELPSEGLPKVRVFRETLEHPLAKLQLRELMEFTTDQGTAVHAKLAGNADPLLQFVANLQLAGAGDTAAAQRLYDLLHKQDLTHEQIQCLATWARGVGIHVKTDTADTIFEHVRTVMSHEPKFKPGDAAPDFEAADTAGNKLSLKNLAGRIVVLHFWATSCGPCMGEMDTLKTELAGYSPLQVEIIFVSLDEDRQVFDEALQKLALPFRHVFDGAGWGGNLARTFGVNAMPSNVIIDGKGIVRSLDLAELPALTGKKETTNQTNRTNGE